MQLKRFLGACLLGFAASTSALQLPDDHIVWGEGGKDGLLAPRQVTTTTSSAAAAASTSPVADSSCSNGPLTRSCWSNGYSIATDFDQKWPTTGVTRYVGPPRAHACPSL